MPVREILPNELGMKPNTTRTRYKDTFNTLEDSKLAIAKIEMISNRDASVIDAEGKLELEAECLPDGSIVYNVYLCMSEYWQG